MSKLPKFVLFFVLLNSLVISPLSAQVMDNYCITPPFVVAGVQPNLLLLIDNSASMYDPVYLSATQTYCYDDTFDNSKDYLGYFSIIDPETQAITYPVYRYNFDEGKFIEIASLAGGCTYATPYVCINLSAGPMDKFEANGRFLNWLSSSKLDVQKLVLTGGKYDTANGVLVGESRGCLGRRFIRELPAIPGITFAIRGPNALEPDNVNSDTLGGLARIEIFEDDYQESYCEEAIKAWESGNQGQWDSNAVKCFNPDKTVKGNELAVFIESVKDCYQIKDNIAHNRTNPDPADNNGLFRNVSLTNLKTLCGNVYTKDCSDPANIDTCLSLNDKGRGNYICSSAVTHLDPGSIYDSLGSDGAGFVGRCWKENAGAWPNNEACAAKELLHFCNGYAGTEVIDPSFGASGNATTGNIPAVIIDAGARSLRDPLKLKRSFCTRSAAVSCSQDSDCPFYPQEECGRFLYVKVGSTVPKGLIQEFAADRPLMRMGAMSFNCTGSASEDIPGSCKAGPNLDAGRVLEEAYIGSPAGDHNSGMIKEIDEIRADSWTPFSEAFYNAIGYYSQDTSRRVNSADGQKDFLTHAEDPSKPDPVQHTCQRNNVLIITDGMPTADQNGFVRSFVRNTIVPAETASGSNNDGHVTIALSPAYTTPPEYFGSLNLDDLAWYAHNFSIFDQRYNNFSADPSFKVRYAKETITTHVVYTGDPCPLKDANGICDAAGENHPEKLMQETALHGGGTYQRIEDPAKLYQTLKHTFQTIAARASSGTAASVLASGEGSGANLIQALFYPKRSIGNTSVEWTGSLQNFWYYMDPFLGNSSIREDTASPGELNLRNDRIMHFRFPASLTDQNTVADLYADSDGDSDADSYAGTKYLDENLSPSDRINYLWEAGNLLWARDPLSRNIYTFDGTNRVKISNSANPINAGTTLITLLQAMDVNEANAIVRYIRGEDTPFSPPVSAGHNPVYRKRTVTINGTSHPWKLGDIVTSTPKVSSWTPLNVYHKLYGDNTYGPIGYDPKLTDPANANNFISTADYKKRGMVFVGANDGMLHAFKLGTVKLFEEKFKKAELSGTNLGEEMWAYIPKHALPYLKYTADPNYCHLYFVDAAPHLFDVSIGGNPGDQINVSSWRTVLIGGMRFGGACRDSVSPYSVQTPAPGIGYSSYFALDITETLSDPSKPPEVLWEFSDEEIARFFPEELETGRLGFATSGPAVVRIGLRGRNGRWFVVFGSGPTGPIDTLAHQFKGYSDQSLKLFIIDLKNGPSPGNIWKLNSGIPNAFAGSLIGAPIDLDQNNASSSGFYQDDAIYFGYTQAEADPAASRWSKGGVLRLVTKEAEPSQWALSTVINNIGPVTSTVSKLQNYKTGDEALWLFFGTGRYFYKIGALIDDADSPRKVYGIKEPCFDNDPGDHPKKLDPDCARTLSEDDLGDVTENSADAKSDGWKILLDQCTNSAGIAVPCTDPGVVFSSERVLTDPLAATNGAVFYTTVKPSADVCEFGGITHLWAVRYDSGGALKKGILRGKALIQVSTGSIEEKDLSTAFTEKRDAGAEADKTVEFRRTAPIPGLASTEKPQINIPPKPMRTILHIRER